MRKNGSHAHQQITQSDEISAPGDYLPYATWCASTQKQPLDTNNIHIKMAVLRGLHSTWPANKEWADAQLWEYGSKIIAGDY